MAADAPAGSIHERRHWVRIVAACNNHCCFCLDRRSLDGSLRPRTEIEAELRAGRAAAATRLILSGGEPTLHPHLPELIRRARELGYGWVQIITNGRRLAYPTFFQALLDAGLDEVTFSIHGSGPQVHDAMVGVPGAFAQSFAGLRAALAAGLVVSVDIVLTRRNLADVPTLIRRTLDAGVREYDILWLTPFGGAAEHLSRPQRMFLEPADAPAVHRILELARRGGAVVWTNRIPLAYLEGYEGLVQDPSKLEDELRGRRPMLDRLVHEGLPLPCRDRRRCARCPFGDFCALLHRTVAVARGRRRAQVVRWDPADGAQAAALLRRPRPVSVWLRTDRPPAEWRPESRTAAFAARRLRLEAPASVLAASLADLPSHAVLHLAPTGLRSWPRALLGSAHELVVPLTAHLARLDPAPLRARPGRLVVAAPTAPQGADGWPFAAGVASAARRWLRAAAAVEGLPPCLAAGRPVRPHPEPFDLRWLEPDGLIEPLRVLEDFVAEAHRAFSLRCAGCDARLGCAGVPWAMARDCGLALLRPFRRPTPPP
ncbi:MAG: radical SAM protein [Deltaproteobacteria bacterium]|nr:radical SAM protein [Deltaproteobacteria bacterium]